MNKIFTLLTAGTLFAAAAHAQTIANAGMETWRSYTVSGSSYESPTEWYSLDSTLAIVGPSFGSAGKQHVFKSTQSNNGSFSAKIMTRSYALFGSLPGALSNAKINIDIANTSYALTGGTPVTQRTANAAAWVKYIPKNAGDSASIAVQAVLAGRGSGGADSVVGMGLVKIPAKANFGQVSVPVTYINSTVVPDHIQVAFLSGNFLTGTAVDSSTLYVDDVTLTNNVGVTQRLSSAHVVHVYPNPATTALQLSSSLTGKLRWEAISTNGQVIRNKEFIGQTEVSLGNIPAGIYFYRVLDEQGAALQTGQFAVK